MRDTFRRLGIFEQVDESEAIERRIEALRHAREIVAERHPAANEDAG